MIACVDKTSRLKFMLPFIAMLLGVHVCNNGTSSVDLVISRELFYCLPQLNHEEGSGKLVLGIFVSIIYLF